MIRKNNNCTDRIHNYPALSVLFEQLFVVNNRRRPSLADGCDNMFHPGIQAIKRKTPRKMTGQSFRLKKPKQLFALSLSFIYPFRSQFYCLLFINISISPRNRTLLLCFEAGMIAYFLHVSLL